MSESPIVALQQRIVALEEALAEYAGLYGLTPRARRLFAEGSLEATLARLSRAGTRGGGPGADPEPS